MTILAATPGTKLASTKSISDQVELITDGERHTVGELLDAWLTFVEPTQMPKTIYENNFRIKKRLRPAFGHFFVDELTTAMLERQYREWLEELSSTSVAHLHSTMNTALNHALRWGWIDRNPASLCQAPRIRRFDIQVMTPEQFRWLYKQAHGPRRSRVLAATIGLAALTGARRGELAGLRWRDVDLEGKQLTISRAISQVGGIIYVGPTKTKRPRTIALDDSAIRVLRSRLDAVTEMAGAKEATLVNEAYVLSRDPDGSKPFPPAQITGGYVRLVRTLGLKTTRPQTLLDHDDAGRRGRR